MLSPIEHSDESIWIENFLAIRSGSLKLSSVTSIIGPQASGKSIYAKLVYFGRTYLYAFFHEVFTEEFSVRDFKAGQVKKFLELFGGLNGFTDPFEIQYQYGDFTIRIERRSERHKPKISQNAPLDRAGESVKREYQRFTEERNKDDRQRNRPPSHFGFVSRHEGSKEFFDSVPNVLFVPAARSFYSTISDELFTFLASDERVDPLTAQFGSFYEFAKRKAGGDYYGLPTSQAERAEINRKLSPVIDGEFIREKSKDFIKTTWGRVPLRSSSSGQQEALPLLFSLLEYPGSRNGPHLIIIEEPEAHLFPSAQKYVLDFIVEAVVSTNCDTLFTTHSPYVLACLNNHIQRQIAGKNKPQRPISYGAHLANSGTITDILNEDDGLIDTNFLDEVSERIAREFMEALD